MKPLSPERRAAIERILPKAKPASDGDGDWAECYDTDVRDLLAAEHYWRAAVRDSDIEKPIEEVACTYCHEPVVVRKPDGKQVCENPACPWVLAQETE